MAEISIEDNKLTIKRSFKNPQEFYLDALKHVWIYSEEEQKIISSHVATNYLDLNNENEKAVNELMDDIIVKGDITKNIKGRYGIKGVQFLLGDFDGNAIMIWLSEFKQLESQFLEKLKQYYPKRIRLIKEWVDKTGETILNGKSGTTATLRLDGVHFKAKDKFVAWSDIGSFGTETKQFVTVKNSIVIIPAEFPKGMFPQKHFHYIKGVPRDALDLYMVEFYFWKNRSEGAISED